MNRTFSYSLPILFLLNLSDPICGQGYFDPGLLSGKDEITVVITDSGLGGLSVMDDVAAKMKLSRCFKKVNLIFVNALFNANTGYNTLKKRDEKIRIFSNVLKSIGERYDPDVILIACNTLSVIYKETEFVKKSKIPVIGIVEPGVKLIREKLESDCASDVIIFGTETTIEENSHLKALIEQKASEKRIITKACPQLQSYIEKNPAGEETELLIAVYLNEALEQLPENHGAVYLSLNCSHFGYSAGLWKKAFPDSHFTLGGILDPNYAMGDLLVFENIRNRFSDTEISFLIVSGVELFNKDAMINIFNKNSPELAEALKDYSIIPDLVNFK
jgi:glutamate racemase